MYRNLYSRLNLLGLSNRNMYVCAFEVYSCHIVEDAIPRCLISEAPVYNHKIVHAPEGVSLCKQVILYG